MQNFLTSSLNKCADYLRNQMYGSSTQTCKLVENQQNIIYFTAFDLDIIELEKTYSFVINIQQNLFRKIKNVTQYTLKENVDIPNKNDDFSKTLALFSICFLHYYTKFSYTKCPTFNDFFTQELILLCKQLGVNIIHMNQFKVYCYSFYYQIINELNQLEYQTIMQLGNLSFIDDSKGKMLSMQNLKEVVDRKIIQPVVSAKERIIDMVYFLGKKEEPMQIMPINQNLNSSNEIKATNKTLFEIYSNSLEEMENITHKMNKLETLSNSNSSSCNNDNDNNSSSNASTGNDMNPIYSKRILSEMSKCNYDDNAKKVIEMVTNYIDLSYFDEIINSNQYDIKAINPFICNIIEKRSEDLLVNYPKAPKDYICRFIIISKKMYAKALEIYVTLYNLSYTQTNTFEHMTKLKFGLGIRSKKEEDIANCLMYFYKLLTEEFDNQSQMQLKGIQNVLNSMQKKWKEFVVDKFQNLTTFCSIE